MDEIELKLQVPAARRAAVDAAVAGRTGRARTRLQAAYHDTAERTLAAAGLALRMRREGRQWVQTLKGAADDGMTRHEHNVPRGQAAALPPIAPELHAGTPVGDTLMALLAAQPQRSLDVLFRTDILRRARSLRVAQGRVELAFDTGTIHAGDAKLGVCELEIELLAGSKQAVLATARHWLPRYGLWLDTRSKAERGNLLARGESMAPPRLALPVRLAARMSAAAAWQAVLRSCADQIIGNASQIAAGEHAPEHVHQLRVGLRRLRSALRLFRGLHDTDAALGEAAAALFRGLGAARDSVVIEAVFATELGAALRCAGLDAPGFAADPGDDPAAAPTDILRASASQMLLLDLLAGFHPDGDADLPDAGPGLRERLARRLNRWHRQVVADAARFTELDDAGRHVLRKRAKRLRYATEFCGALFEPRARSRYLRALRALQERLGAIADAVMTMQAFARARDADPRAMFALGWLTARRELLIREAAPALKAFAKVERFWRKKRG